MLHKAPEELMQTVARLLLLQEVELQLLMQLVVVVAPTEAHQVLLVDQAVEEVLLELVEPEQ